MSDLTPTRIYYETRELCHRDVYKHLAVLRKSLLDLKLVSKKALLDSNLYWQQEVERAKLEKDKEWRERVNLAEAENKRLRTVIQNLTKPDESKTNYDLQLWEAENQIDKLSRQLDKKLIHINQLQLSLAEQSKAMFELERSYVLLYCQYKKSWQKDNPRLRKTELKSENSKSKLHPSSEF